MIMRYTPQLRIYYNGNVEVTDEVVSFRYKYSEKEDDECSITFKSDDPNLPDRPYFQEGTSLIVVWGYVETNDFVRRKVYIWDTKPEFNDKGVTIVVTAYDKFAITKLNSSKKVRKQMNVQELWLELSNTYGFIATNVVDEHKQSLFLDDSVHPHNPKDIPLIFPKLKLKEEEKVTPIIRTGEGGSVYPTELFITPLALNLKKTESIPQAGKSDYALLREEADKQEGGPIIVKGRDDALIVGVRNFNQAPRKVFVYKGEGSPIISFEPETKNKERGSSQQVSAGGTDPETGAYSEYPVDALENSDTRLGSSIDYTPSGNGPRFFYPTNLTTGQLTALDKEAQIDKIRRANTLKVITDKNYSQGINMKPSESKDGIRTVGIDHVGRVIKNFEILDTAEDIYDQGTDPATAQAEAANKQKEEELKKNPANLTTIGEPTLQDGIIVGIKNASKKFSGNYYVTECEHIIVRPGYYKTISKLVRNATNTVSNTPSNKIKAPESGVNSQSLPNSNKFQRFLHTHPSKKS